jgi:hypothetical protein
MCGQLQAPAALPPGGHILDVKLDEGPRRGHRGERVKSLSLPGFEQQSTILHSITTFTELLLFG